MYIHCAKLVDNLPRDGDGVARMRGMRRFDGKKNPERRKYAEEGGDILLGVGEAGDFGVPADEYRKTSTIYAIRIDEPFEVDTIEGLHTAKAGDWLALGQAGELYPIDAAVFAATYELVK